MTKLVVLICCKCMHEHVAITDRIYRFILGLIGIKRMPLTAHSVHKLSGAQLQLLGMESG